MCLLIPILLSLHLEPETVSVRNFPMGLGISTLQVVVLLQGWGWGGRGEDTWWTLLEKVRHWRTGFEIKSLVPFPVPSLWFLLTIGIFGFLILKLHWPCCRASPHDRLLSPRQPKQLLLKLLWSQCYHSPREVPIAEQMGKAQTEVIHTWNTP